jgi:hypothetical protein
MPPTLFCFGLPSLAPCQQNFQMSLSTDELPDFHPQTVLRDWGNGQGFRLADALTGVCVFGATGSCNPR